MILPSWSVTFKLLRSEKFRPQLTKTGPKSRNEGQNRTHNVSTSKSYGWEGFRGRVLALKRNPDLEGLNMSLSFRLLIPRHDGGGQVIQGLYLVVKISL